MSNPVEIVADSKEEIMEQLEILVPKDIPEGTLYIQMSVTLLYELLKTKL